jgi:hypothetical protein
MVRQPSWAGSCLPGKFTDFARLSCSGWLADDPTGATREVLFRYPEVITDFERSKSQLNQALAMMNSVHYALCFFDMLSDAAHLGRRLKPSIRLWDFSQADLPQGEPWASAQLVLEFGGIVLNTGCYQVAHKNPWVDTHGSPTPDSRSCRVRLAAPNVVAIHVQ